MCRKRMMLSVCPSRLKSGKAAPRKFAAAGFRGKSARGIPEEEQEDQDEENFTFSNALRHVGAMTLS